MADYVEFTVNVNEDSSIDSDSSIREKVKNSSDRPSENEKLVRQAKFNMENNNTVNKEDKLNGKAVKAFIINDVVKEGINTGMRIINDSYAQQFKYGGNSAAMNKMNNTINDIKGGVSFLTNIAGYATAGTAIYPGVGTAIGAVVGLVSSVFDTFISYNNSNSELQWKLQEERVNAQALTNRLGISASSRGRTPFTDFKL